MKDHIDNVIVEVIQDPNDPDQLLLDLGLELCQRLGWQPGDQVEWQDCGDGTWTINKIS